MLFGRLKPCVCFISFSLQIWNHHSLHRMKWKQYETVSQIIPAVQSCHSFKLLPLCNLVCQVQRLSIGPSRLAKQTTEKRRKTEKEEKEEKKGKKKRKIIREIVVGVFLSLFVMVFSEPSPALFRQFHGLLERRLDLWILVSSGFHEAVLELVTGAWAFCIWSRWERPLHLGHQHDTPKQSMFEFGSTRRIIQTENTRLSCLWLQVRDTLSRMIMMICAVNLRWNTRCGVQDSAWDCEALRAPSDAMACRFIHRCLGTSPSCYGRLHRKSSRNPGGRVNSVSLSTSDFPDFTNGFANGTAVSQTCDLCHRIASKKIQIYDPCEPKTQDSQNVGIFSKTDRNMALPDTSRLLLEILWHSAGASILMLDRRMVLQLAQCKVVNFWEICRPNWTTTALKYFEVMIFDVLRA